MFIVKQNVNQTTLINHRERENTIRRGRDFLKVARQKSKERTCMNVCDTMNKSRIVKISEFCQGSARGKRRQGRRIGHHSDGISLQGNTHHDGPILDDSIMSIPLEKLENTMHTSPLDVAASDEETTLNSGTVVNVSILKSLPEEKEREEENPQNAKSVGAVIMDEYATIYTCDVQLLIAIGAFHGHLCMISKEDDDLAIGRRLWAPVILKVLHNNQGQNIAKNSTCCYHVFIPPTIAATIGVHDFGCLELPLRAHIRSLSQKMTIPPLMKTDADTTMSQSVDDPSLPAGFDIIPLAKKAFVAECFRPPHDCLPTSLEILYTATKQKEYLKCFRQEKNSRQIDNLQNFFFRESLDGSTGRTPISRLVTIGSIIAVVEDDSKTIQSQSNNCLVGANIRSKIRYYKVEKVEMEDKSVIFYNVPPSISGNFCRISPETQLILQSEGEAKVDDDQICNMPQLSSTWVFYQSIRQKQEIPYARLMKTMWSHPNLQDIVKTLAAMKDSVLCSPSSRGKSGFAGSQSRHILHIIGHEDNHIKHCLDVAADSGKFASFRNVG
jgi:hypothetical protein